VVDRGEATYPQLLEQAQELGRADGRFAAGFETPGPADDDSPRCLGRTPEEFARLLWAGRAGSPPSGLELNAPLWYARGFAEGLAARTAQLSRTAEWARTRRVFT
jgi:hypothetical protein